MSPPGTSALGKLVGLKGGEQTELRLQHAVARVASALGVDAEEAAGRILRREGRAFAIFCDAVTVQETYFFRHPEHFALLERCAIDALGRGRPFRTAWSVGCCTGEEVWSIAMTLMPWAPELRVAGSDLSAEALAVARAGSYAPRSFRDVNPARYPGLSLRAGRWEVSTRIRERAHFNLLNVATDPIRPPAGLPAQVDAVFCRNVLVYLKPDVVETVIRALAACVEPGGVMILGTVEAPTAPPEGFELVDAANPGVFRRRSLTRARARAPGRTPSGSMAVPAAAAAPKAVLRGMDATSAEALTESRRMANEGRFDEALERAHALRDLPEALHLSASIHFERGNLVRAAVLLHQMLKLQPDSVPAHLQLALVALRRGDLQALEQHRRAVQRLLAGRPDEEDLGVGGMKAAWARQVLESLGTRAGA